jgi:single-strand DNA-binding protein
MSAKLLTVEGNLGASLIVKILPSGKKVCSFSIAENLEWMDATNTKQKKTEWHSVECWDKDAEYSEKHLTKGSKVSVTGTVKLSNWKDKEGNEKFAKTIQAKKIDFISAPKAKMDVAEAQS